MLVGQVAGQRATRAEHTDSSVAAQEDWLVVEIAAQREERARAGHHPHRIDTDPVPEVLVAAEHPPLGRCGECLGFVVGIDDVIDHDVRIVGVVVHLLVDLGLGRGLSQLGLGLLRRGLIDVGCADDGVERVDHVVPAASDHRLDLGPPLAAGAAGEGVDSAAQLSEHRVAVEELGDRGQLAHRADRRHDGQSPMQLRHRLLAGLLGDQLLHTDDVVLPVLGGIERVRVRLGQLVPRRMVGEVVVLAGPDECGQVSHRLEGIQIVVLAEERLPLIALITPAGSPQCVQVALGQPEPDRHDFSSHAAQPNHPVREPSRRACVCRCARRRSD